ncbi:adenylate cyclase type 10 [Sorex araneus]|uniref:adenylate cyclase type 10 n=1 Tax=Sorex araneus TaxID=42254 RepID=UPI002433AB46|nr:adenylate cyclase type 10 [Sorex araneus]
MNPRNEELEERAIVRIAAHLPDLILYGAFSPEKPSVDYFDGVLMFVDISGFTAMTERFSTAMYMDRGAEQLVEILNHYISAMVEKVLLFGGDILKFAGDALLALWKVERRQLKNIITIVVKCSLEIHGLFDDQEWEEGLDIRVKIGLAAGHITRLVFGDDTRNYFLVIGQAVDDVRLAQNMAQMNDVILSPNCWQLCDRNMIEIERIPDQRAVKVNFLKPPPSFNFDEFFTKCMNFMDYYPSGNQKNLLRLACMLESDPELELSLQKYVMESILKQIDDKQLGGYLSELRPVTIVFVNLMFKDQNKAEVIGSAIQDACVHINAVLRTFRGQINKVFMFDKGCSFLCVFGFPGEKAPDEVTHALESAVDIFDFCSQVHKIHTVSIGVASGIVFCGIIGHTVRHEYTVIGQKVNFAARMMMYYPGVVSCDSVTYSGSNLPAYFFKELPKKVMKGVTDSGPVYQCLGLNEKVMFGMAYLICNRNKGYPLLGRNKEIDYFVCTMKEFLMANSSRVLMFEGMSGYGKSQLLVEIEYLAQGENHRTVAIVLTKISFTQSFYTIQILLANVLGLDTCKHYKERQTSLESEIRTLLNPKSYCLLNDIFHVQFPISREISKMSPEKKQAQLEALFIKILEQAVRVERIIFIVDEAQFIDPNSWAFLEKLLREVPIFLITSLSPFTDIPCKAASSIMKSRTTTYITLGALQPKDIRNKVCLDLNVHGIPKELDLYLVKGSCGIPFYCEELLKNLEHHHVLVFRSLELEEKSRVNWHTLFKDIILPTDELKPHSANKDESQEICNLASGIILKNLSPPSSLKEMSLVQLDSMSLSHQMLVRCAAILGLTFTTELLFEILPCWNMKMMIKALAKLVKSKVFGCYRDGRKLRLALRQNPVSAEVHYRSLSLRPAVGIIQGEKEELWELENEVIECNIIRFCKPVMQKTAYELWLKHQKRELHLKCARFLEEDARRCDHCQSGDFVPFHHFVVDIRLNTLDIGTIHHMAKAHGFQTEEKVASSKLDSPRKPEFTEDMSLQKAQEKTLQYFDAVIDKMKTSEDMTPLESCQCEETLEIVVQPLAQHFLALGENNKALYYFLEVAAAYVFLGDHYTASISLNEAERLLRLLNKKKSSSQIFELATFYSLKGQVCSHVGQLDLAKKMLRKALRLLNRPFPYNLISLFLQLHMEENRHFHYMTQQAQESPPPRKKRLAQLYQQAGCLALLWRIYSLNYFFHCKYYCSLAALMQLNTALETQNDFQIIKAYLDYSLNLQLLGHQEGWNKYEVLAMNCTLALPLKGENTEAVAHVADTLSYTKYIMGHLDLAIDLGFRAHKMWVLIRNPDRRCHVLCWLSQCLLLRNRLKQLVQVLGWLWDLSVAEEHIYSKAFFYYICLDIMLYAGFFYRTFEECLEFVSENEDNKILKYQSGILLGLYSCIAIWYGRLQEWDNFHNFSNRAKGLVPRKTPTATYCQGVSRYLEGRVLFLKQQMEKQVESAQDSGMKLLKRLEVLVAQHCTGPVFYPRLYHLMSYVCILMGDGEHWQLFLRSAQSFSERQGNVLEKGWLSMNKECWCASLTLVPEPWQKTIERFPSWEMITSGKMSLQKIQKNKFLLGVNVLETLR